MVKIILATVAITSIAFTVWLIQPAPPKPTPPAKAFTLKPGDRYYMTREEFLRGIPDTRREGLPLELRKPWLFPWLNKKPEPIPRPRPAPRPRTKPTYRDV